MHKNEIELHFVIAFFFSLMPQFLKKLAIRNFFHLFLFEIQTDRSRKPFILERKNKERFGTVETFLTNC